MIARTVGAAARRLLQEAQTAALVGHTSRGAFLALDSGEPVFLSLEGYHGPLTVNVASPMQPLRELPVQAPARLHAQEIIFEQHGISIQTAGAETWLAPPRPENPLSQGVRRVFGEEVLQQAVQQGEAEGLLAAVAALLGLEAAVERRPLPTSLLAIRDYLRQRQIEGAAAAIQPLLGYGRGLTPAGDDLALGLLLALGRWGDVLAPDLEVQALERLVLPAAAWRTTALSASLIACAAQGQADERLLAALDGLLCGGVTAERLVAGVSTWGNTSGLQALAGMLLVVIP